MADAEKARARNSARMVSGMTVAAMMLAAAPAAFAAPNGDHAPIVFASAETPAPTIDAPSARPSSGLFQNSISSKTLTGALSDTSPRALSTAKAASTGPSGAIDLRPGAVHTIDASFGPAFSSVDPRPRTPGPLVSKLQPPVSVSLAAPASGYATPYAGAPYQVAGKWYVPAYEPNYDEIGIASWYGPTFHGKASASGETFDEMGLTAAHPTLPIPSIVRVTNLENGRTTLVRVNDRGPFVDSRIIDLSRHAGEVLGLHDKGTAKVRVQYVGPAPAEANSLPENVVSVAQHVPVTSIAPAASEIIPPAESAPVLSPREMPQLVNSPVTLPSPTPDVREMSLAAPAAPAGFSLQVGSFGDPANADALRSRLATLGPVSVVKASVGGRQYYRVMVGPWGSRGQAAGMQAGLLSAGYKAIVVASGD